MRSPEKKSPKNQEENENEENEEKFQFTWEGIKAGIDKLSQNEKNAESIKESEETEKIMQKRGIYNEAEETEKEKSEKSKKPSLPGRLLNIRRKKPESEEERKKRRPLDGV